VKDLIIGKGIGILRVRSIMNELLGIIYKPVQAFVSADPYSSRIITCNRRYITSRNGCAVRRIVGEWMEMISIEAVKAIPCAHPQVTVAVSKNALNNIIAEFVRRFNMRNNLINLGVGRYKEKKSGYAA